MIYKWLDSLIIKCFRFLMSAMNAKYKYRNNFRKINFFDKNKKYPKVLNVKKYKDGRAVIVCRSVIPLTIWNKQIEYLESAFNSRIKLVKTNQKQVIKLILFKGVWKNEL